MFCLHRLAPAFGLFPKQSSRAISSGPSFRSKPRNVELASRWPILTDVPRLGVLRRQLSVAATCEFARSERGSPVAGGSLGVKRKWHENHNEDWDHLGRENW